MSDLFNSIKRTLIDFHRADTKPLTQPVHEGSASNVEELDNTFNVFFGFPGTKHTFLKTYETSSSFTKQDEVEFNQIMNSPEVKKDPVEGRFQLRDFYQRKILQLPSDKKTMSYQRDTQATVSGRVEDFWLKFPRDFMKAPLENSQEASIKCINLQVNRYKKLLEVCEKENFDPSAIHKNPNIEDNQIYFRHNAFLKLEKYTKKPDEFFKIQKEFQQINEVSNPLSDQSEVVRPRLQTAIEQIHKENPQASHKTNAELYAELSKRELCRLKTLINKLGAKAEGRLTHEDYPELHNQITKYVDSSILADFFSSRCGFIGPEEYSFRPTQSEASNWVFNINGLDEFSKVQKIGFVPSNNNGYDPRLFDIFTNNKVSTQEKSRQRDEYLKEEKRGHIRKRMKQKKHEIPSKTGNASTEIKIKNNDFASGAGQPNPPGSKGATRQYSTKKPDFEERSELTLDFGTLFADFNMNFIFIIFIMFYFTWLNNKLKNIYFFADFFLLNGLFFFNELLSY